MKLIANIVPFPTDAQSCPFFCALASALLPAHEFTEDTPFYCARKASPCMECGNCGGGNLKKHHAALYHDYQTVSGVSFGWAWPEDSSEYHTIPGAGPNWRWPDEFVGFLMDFTGLAWRRLEKGEGKEEVAQAIAASVDAGFPVLLKLGSGPDWHVVTGYDGEILYGLDSHAHYDSSVRPQVRPDRYTEGGLFVLSEWYGAFEGAILIEGRRKPSATLSDVLRRVIAVLEHPAHARLETELYRRIERINADNANETAHWLNEIAGFPIEARYHAAEAFTSGKSETYGLLRMTGRDDVRSALGRIFFSYIADNRDETHGALWKVWAQLGVGPETGYAVPQNAGELVMRPETQAELRRLFAFVFKNDRDVLATLKEALALGA